MKAEIHMLNGEIIIINENFSLNGQFYSEVSDVMSFFEYLAPLFRSEINCFSRSIKSENGNEYTEYIQIKQDQISHFKIISN